MALFLGLVPSFTRQVSHICDLFLDNGMMAFIACILRERRIEANTYH
jgi:hypothetical protein